MTTKGFRTLVIILVFALLVSIIPACQPVFDAESYLAVVPRVLHSGGSESISLALFKGDNLIPGEVEVTMLKEGQEILKVKEDIDGKGTVRFDIPDIEEGDYEIRIKGNGFEDMALVTVERSFLVFLETDKPIYKPGQTIHMRIFTLNPELRPKSEPVIVEVLDAKGIKIFRSELSSDEYGMASLDLPLSQEPNLGVWKINAATDNAESQLDVRVEEYVLPKYEVKAELPREWFLVSEPITGTISAEYSFGKAVKGELEIIASKYVGEWEEYATFTVDIDGQAEFELPAAGYVAGVPGAGGQGNVMLDITIREMATGYEEKINKLLTIAETPHNLQIIAEGLVFKPGLPFSLLIISETPDNQPIDTEVAVTITYLDNEYQEMHTEEKQIDTTRGKAIIELIPPQDSVALIIEAFELTPESSVEPAQASKILQASYSPSDSFIHIEQISDGIPRTGEDAIFNVYSTSGRNFYYEVVSGNRVVFSDFTRSSRISFPVTPQMAPTSRLLVYQILPNSEVAADYIPFKVEAEYPHGIKVEFNQDEARPGDEVNINIQTEGEAKVGIAAVDKSVFILAENRLNLQQVFDELERLYMQPQVEIHEVSIYPAITTRGAQEVFTDAGVIVLSNNRVPEGKDYEWQGQQDFWDGVWKFFNGGFAVMEGDMQEVPAPNIATVTQTQTSQAADSSGLAEVERIRQFFPETWLWEEVTIDQSGQITVPVQVPDTITTWMLRAVAISKENGLGIAEDELRAFQPFFLKVDLPYSTIRGEEFPVKISVYNYLDQPQSVLVQIQEAGWFELLDETQKTVEIAAGDVGSVQFNISPNGLGFNEIKLTAQSTEAADAVVKTLLVQPEGIPREFVDNLILSAGSSKTVDTSIADLAVPDSSRAYISVTSSYLTQTIDGLEELIQMPFGCGEQNMLLFAPDVFITRYLEESGQLKPEIMAKAEKLMITGYQREMTYRRSDGSFSAFGESDDIGSLWLTAFVLKSFAQAEDIIYIDQSVLSEAATWITSHQNSDGSFDVVGFVHHQEMIGGVSGKNALTAYVATALLEAGENVGVARAVSFLEKELDAMDEPYTVAITAYALELAGSNRGEDAYQKLMALAEEDENGLHWGGGEMILPTYPEQHIQSATIEATAYATLALIKHGDAFNASRGAKWLVSQRNAYGGYGSTQDTVVALQALTEYSTDARADVDLTVRITAPGFEKELKVTAENFDVLQIVEVPINLQIEIATTGQGEAIGQVVRRFNLPQAENEQQIININVNYDTTQVEVNDLVNVSVSVEFNPQEPIESGMVVLDISVPTGFAPVAETLDRLLEQEARIKRYEIAGRKVIFYIENMFTGDKISFGFQVVALHPVKAKAVSSLAYSYYKPELRGETLGQEITVS
jgi:CD109 antigen